MTVALLSDWTLTQHVPVLPPSGFKLKHFLRDDESLSSFLQRNASFPEDAVQQVMEAHVNLEQVSRLAALDLRGTSQIWTTFTFRVLSASGPPQRLRRPPEGHVSQKGGTAEPAGLCCDFGCAGIGAGPGSPVCGPAHLAEPC